MTGMPSGRPSEPRTGPAAPAPAHGDGPTGPSAPTGRTALRDRIAQALYEWAVGHTTGGARFLAGGTDKPLRENSLARADAILPVVEDAIARYRMQVDDPDSLLIRLDQAERERDDYHQRFANQMSAANELIRELRRAERALAQARDAIADERKGRLAAEAAVRRAREVLPFFEGQIEGIRELYPVLTKTLTATYKQLLAALDAEQPEPTRRAEPVRWNVCPDCLGRHPDGASCALDAEETR